MHATDWTPAYRVRGWIVQEKFNGIRALWTGTDLLSREGNVLHAPAWFTAGLPAMALDCELILASGKSSAATVANIARTAGADWSRLRLVIFDAPEVAGGYAARHASIWGVLPAHIRVAEFSTLQTLPILRDALAQLHRDGGEGFMLRDPRAPYVAGRTRTMMKFKSRSLYQ